MTGPLTGLRVIEMAGLGPAPFAGMVFADLGATVVRVDRVGTHAVPLPPREDLQGRGKRSIAVDLKRPEGAALVRDLAARADVLVEGYRPGVAERLGIGPAECHAVNPRLVYGRVTGWGQEGPLAATAGHDITYLARTGVLHAIGRADGPPVPPLNLLGDYGGGGMLLVAGVLAALWQAQRTGEGQVVDAAIVDGTTLLATQLYGLLHSGAWQDRRGANLLDGGAPFYGVYETADGRHLAVGPLEPRFYAEFAARLGLDPAETPDQLDAASWPRLRTLIAARVAARTRDEWAEVFADGDACVAPVLSLQEAPADAHLRARGTFVEAYGVRQPAPAPRFSATPAAAPTLPPPVPGEHTRAVLEEWAIPDVDALLSAAVAHQA
ncbi:CaiB/BaiF CoA transferase family protein [Phytohabitans suffuscus]|uniref:CoA transferase n=1 Tax=Phytohabitans suffuscus TaxID=624315 RepID=A0A6F8YH63_9ACTN|nr:CaiB/BaiF CoA-transferase family protein [Phytohabitans suffuscus]BCB85465.1 CoA transferase [Phytohabitans suffuscus]